MMVRVGFVFEFLEPGWLGGFSYYRNLLGALRSLPGRRIETVIFTGRRIDANRLAEFPAADIVHSSFLDARDPLCILRKLWVLATARDIFLERLLTRSRIDILSHSGYLGHRAKIPAVGWIPDFQYKYFPEYFSPLQRTLRHLKYRRMCELCACVLLSSVAAKKDLERFIPDRRAASRVIRFVPSIPHDPAPSKREEIARRFGFSGPYFLVPNQFWAHKNHPVLIEALRILKSQGRMVLVLATGSTTDGRKPGYFSSLMASAQRSGVLDCFRVLGIVPYRDLVGLMRNAVSLINPSLFEGWSTTVEEAKALGKRIILSDIPVHREQDPERGVYFPPDDPHLLAQAMWQLWLSDDPGLDEVMFARQQETTAVRIAHFAKSYEEAILGVLAKDLPQAGETL